MYYNVVVIEAGQKCTRLILPPASLFNIAHVENVILLLVPLGGGLYSKVFLILTYLQSVRFKCMCIRISGT